MKIFSMWLLLFSGVFGEPQTSEEALTRLQEKKEMADLLLTLDEFEGLALKSPHFDKAVSDFEKLVTSDWSLDVQKKYEDVLCQLQGNILKGRPKFVRMNRVLKTDVEILGHLSRDQIDQLDAGFDSYDFSWDTSMSIYPNEVLGTQRHWTHHFQSFLNVTSEGDCTFEIDTDGAWGIAIRNESWFQPRQGKSVPNVARIGIYLPKGEYVIDIYTSGRDSVAWRLIEGNAKWKNKSIDEQEKKINPKSTFKAKSLPIIEALKDSPEARARWLVHNQLGDLLNERQDLWEEIHRIHSDHTMDVEVQQVKLAAKLEKLNQELPEHSEGWIWKARLGREQNQLSRARKSLQKAEKLKDNSLLYLSESIELDIKSQNWLQAGRDLNILSKRAPRWFRTEYLKALYTKHQAPADQIFVDSQSVELLRLQTDFLHSFEARKKAFEKLISMCPWEQTTKLRYRKFLLQSEGVVGSGDWVKSPFYFDMERDFQNIKNTSFADFKPSPELYKIPKSLPDEYSALLYDMMGVEFHADGSITEVIHQLIRIHGDYGVREWSSMVPWGPIEILKVLTPDGKQWIPLVIPGEKEVTLPRLVPGALIEIRTRRTIPSLDADDYDSNRFYFRDPQRQSLLSHSLVVLKHPQSRKMTIVENKLKNLGSEQENFSTRSFEQDGIVTKIWEAKDMKASFGGDHPPPDRFELPWVRIQGREPEVMTSANWIAQTEPFCQSGRFSEDLARRVTVKALGIQEKFEALVSWHRENVEDDYEFMGELTLQRRRGDRIRSLTTLLRAGNIEAWPFHLRPLSRFHDPTDQIDRAHGIWPEIGVVAKVQGELKVLVPTKPWYGINQIPESWAGRRGRYWDQGQWQVITMSEKPLVSSDVRSLEVNIKEKTFAYNQKRKGDSLESWKNYLWHDDQTKRVPDTNFDDRGLFRSLEQKWERPHFGHLQFRVQGTCPDIEAHSMSFPSLRTRDIWAPGGPAYHMIWIPEDRVTIDEVTYILPENYELTGIPDDISMSLPGFFWEWKTDRIEKNKVKITRTWRQQAGIISASQAVKLWRFFEKVDVFDRKRWRLAPIKENR